MRAVKSILRVSVVTAMMATGLMTMAGVAQAKAHHHHPSGSGQGGGNGPITIQIDPNPLIETGTSDVDAVIQVETSPSFAGDLVTISSQQMQSVCGGEIDFLTAQGLGAETKNSISVFLDNDGNATVVMYQQDCAPGTSLIEADLEVAPYYTATGELIIEPPAVTPEGLVGFPTTSGTVPGGEVENGDGIANDPAGASGCNSPLTNPCQEDSDVYAVFYVETNPVYAEQRVEISSTQLQDRCSEKYAWGIGNYGTAQGLDFIYNSGGTSTSIDDDGNAAFVFYGESCGAGSSLVTADVEAGTHPTYTTTFNINPPQPTI